MPTAFTVLKHRLLRASTRLSAGQSIRLSLPLSPPGAGGGQSLPDCSGSPTAVAVPPPASGANHLLPVSLPTFLCPFHSYRGASGVALVPPAVKPLVLPRGGRSGVLTRGITELGPAAASSCVSRRLVSPSPSVCPSSTLSRTLLQPAGNICTWGFSQKNVVLFNKLPSKSNLSAPT